MKFPTSPAGVTMLDKSTQRVSVRPPRNRGAGFTLIELMITVAIVAILAALAYPSYRNYVIRGDLVDATNGLSAMRANMERYYQDNRSYAAANGFTPPCTPIAPAATIVSGTFNLSCNPASTATTFTLQAVGNIPNTAGFTFTVDNNNSQATTVAPTVGGGWISCATAWVTKPGGC